MHLDAQFAAGYSVQPHATDDGSFGIGITQWLVLQKDKDAQRSCAIAVDIAGTPGK